MNIVHLLKILLNNPKKFIKQTVLPLETPLPKLKTLREFFFGTPCRKMDMKQGRPKRVKAGMHRCNAQCSICPYVKQQKIIKAKHSNAVVKLSHHYDCNTTNIVYLIECKKCGDHYIGQT